VDRPAESLTAVWQYGSIGLMEDTMKTNGKDIVKAKTTLRLPREMLDAIRHRAIDERTTAQAFIERALAKALSSGRKSR
jgi:predicted DNA binding CopG/RHH family protein